MIAASPNITRRTIISGVTFLLLTASPAVGETPASKPTPISAEDESFFDSATETTRTTTETAQAAADAPTSTADQKDAAAKVIAAAKEQVEQKAQANPGSLPVQNSAARFAMQVGDIETAGKRAEQAVALAQAGGDPKAMAAAQTTRALARYAGKDFGGACADAQRVLMGDPRNVTAYEVKQFSCNRDEKGTLVKEFNVKTLVAQQAPAVHVPHTAEQWTANQRKKKGPSFAGIAGSMKARKAGDLDGALKAAETAVAADPRDPMAYAQRGLVRSDRGELDEAILDLSRAIAMGMVWNALYKIRAQALLKGQKFKAAAGDADIAVVLDPKDAGAYATRGLARLSDGGADPALILADFEEAAKLDPQRYGDLLERSRKDLEARKAQGAQAAGGQAKPGPRMSVPWWASPRVLGFGIMLVGLAGLGACVALMRMSSPPQTGETVGGCYKLGRTLGAGGMGRVYEAFDQNLERRVAIKRMNEDIRDDPEEARRFIQEAKTVAGLKHPNIVAIHDAFQDRGGELYLVFELVGGETLDELVERKGGPLSPRDALEWLEPICEALDYAHGRGVIHRDLKPNNVMIEDGFLKLMDFGIARRTDSAELRTTTQSVAGTPLFMAPEQEEGRLSKESDIYAAGVLAYWLVTGQYPFPGGSVVAKRAGRFPKPSSIRPEAAPLDPILARALAPEPEDRYHSAGQMLQALRDAVPA